MKRAEISAESWRRWCSDHAPGRAALAQGIAAFLTAEIERCDMRHGDRLPSVRQLALICGCSHDTTARAFEELVSAGRLDSRRGAGYFIARRPTPAAAAPVQPDGPVPTLRDGRWLLSSHLPIDRRPGSAVIHPDLAPSAEIGRAARSALRVRQDIFTDYNMAAGYRPLRSELRRVLGNDGIDCADDEIMTGVGATGVLSILIRALIRPHQCVLVEDPCSFIHTHLLLAQGAHIIGIPRDADGPDMAALRAACEAESPRLFLMSARAQNPTGRSISPARAHELRRLSDEFGLTIVDDDSYAELLPERGPPRMALRALGRSDRIVHVSSLTRVVAPGMSVGYLVASGATLRQVLLFKAAQLGAGSVVPERIFYHFLAEGRYRRIIRRLRHRIAERRGETLDALQSHGFSADEEADGLFVWLKVNDDALGEDHVRNMLAKGYLVAPELYFSSSTVFAGYARLNVTTTDTAFLKLLSAM